MAETGLILTDDNELSIGQFRLLKTGLEVTGAPSFDEWDRFGAFVSKAEGAVHWWIGDWLNYGEQKYGEMYAQALNEGRFTYGALRNDKWLASRIELSRRHDNLSWGHHAEVAKLGPAEQDRWLDLAEAEGWPIVELRQHIRVARLENVNTIELDSKPRLIHGDMLQIVPTLGLFDLVVTDPPYGVVPLYDSVDPQEWDRFEDFLQESRKWLTVVKAALKPEYNLLWFCAPSYAARIELIFAELELPIQSRIIWHRRSLPKGRNSTRRFLSTWDMILHAGTRELNFPVEWSDAWFDVQVFSQPLTSSIGIDQKIHETQKPADLITRLVSFGSFPGDRVLDPFAGSGVLGAVCPANRECVLVEKDAEYTRRIEKRLGIRAECPPEAG